MTTLESQDDKSNDNNNAAIIQSFKERNVDLFPDLTAGPKDAVFGVIKDMKPVSRSSKGKRDYFVNFTLIDPAVSKSERGLVVNLFHSSEDAFAKDIAPGDLMLLRTVKINVYYSTRQAVSISGKTEWMALDGESLLPKHAPAMKIQLTEDETAVLKMMQGWYLKSEWYMPRHKITIQYKPSPRLRRTEEVGGNGCPDFFEFVGMVVAYKPSNQMHPGRAELILTDFTPNKKPMIGYEAEGTIDPELLIQCTLWDQNATMCPEVQHGEYVYIRNARWKTSRNGYFEIAVHGESGRGPKIRKIENPNDPNLVAIKKRAEEFWRKQKPKTDTPHNPITIDNVYTVLHHQEPMQPIQAILDDDDHVKRFSVRAFIVDFKPHDPRDWIRKWCPGCDTVDTCDADRCAQCGQPFSQYTYVACFLLEDAHSQKLILYIYGDDARRMFPDMGDVRSEDQYVEKLGERLRQLRSSTRPEKLYLDFGGKSYVVSGRGRCFRMDATEFVFCQ